MKLNKPKIKSPKTNRLILVGGDTYNKLSKEGYFKSLSGIKEIDQEILLHLDVTELKNIDMNKHFHDILKNDVFWCQWLLVNTGMEAYAHCKNITLLYKSGKPINDIYYKALIEGYMPLITYLLNRHLVNPVMGQTVHFNFYPVENDHLKVVELLLTYPEVRNDQDLLFTALQYAVIKNNNDIVEYLLNHVVYDKDDLTNVLSEATRHAHLNLIKILINQGADPNQVIVDATHSNDINTLQLLLSYNVTPQNDDLAIALGLRNYDMLKLLIQHPNTVLKQNLKTQLLSLLTKDKPEFKMIEKLLLPSIVNQDLYHEVRDKWYHKNL